MELRKYQEAARDAVLAEWATGTQKTLVVMPTGCHHPEQKLLMHDGSIKKINEIQIGEKLRGIDTEPRTVLHIQYGTGNMYKINPIKGTSFAVSKDHKLTLVRTKEDNNPRFPCRRKEGEIIDVTVEEYLKWSKWRKHIHKLFRCEAVFDNKLELPISPYFIGAMLGDGSMAKNLSFTNMSNSVVTEINRQLSHYGIRLKPTKIKCGKAVCYSFKSLTDYSHNKKAFRKMLDCIGLNNKKSNNKHIPFIYKTSSKFNRMELLAGLLDTDGHSSCGGYDFVSKSKQLADDVVFVCRSLGLAAYVKPCEKSSQNKTVGIYHRVSISGDCSFIPMRITRKSSPKRRQIKNVSRTGFTISEIGESDYIGVTVDHDNRYLLDDFTVTHNCGKTIVFSSLTKEMVRRGERVLILAHREELLRQAADKLERLTGLECAVEKADATALDAWDRITVGSVQTLMTEKRQARFSPDHYQTIIVDEAHHVLSEGYRRTLAYFKDAKVCGCTATPDRGDLRNLGDFFQSLACEYKLLQAIKDGWLCKIKALSIPLAIDLRSVSTQAGDYKLSDLGDALLPYLEAIADEMLIHCADRKTLVFLPLIATSQKMKEILKRKGMNVREVNGESKDRAEVLDWFAKAGKGAVCCNSMLLTEGYDEPSIDCIVMLRPTKIRSLYVQACGRGTRLSPGKDNLLILDFLWHTSRHELCRPAHLICDNSELADAVTKILAEERNAGGMDLEEAVGAGQSSVVEDREAGLAKKLEELRKKKRALVDPIQYEYSIQAEDLIDYQPAMPNEMGPVTAAQKAALEKAGIYPEDIGNAGLASKILERLAKRRGDGLATPKQIRMLERYGFKHVGQWTFEAGNKMITRIAACAWMVPRGVVPAQYQPEEK